MAPLFSSLHGYRRGWLHIASGLPSLGLPESTLAAIVIPAIVIPAVVELVDVPALVRFYRLWTTRLGSIYGPAARADFIAAVAEARS